MENSKSIDLTNNLDTITNNLESIQVKLDFLWDRALELQDYELALKVLKVQRDEGIQDRLGTKYIIINGAEVDFTKL